MVFEDVPLRRVLKELERYRRGRILLLVEGAGRRCGAGEAVFQDGQQPVGIQQAAQNLRAGPARFSEGSRCRADAWKGEAERTKTGRKCHHAGPKSITARSGKLLSH